MSLYRQVYFGDSSLLYGNYLFPDTTIIGASGIHMLGDILDVNSEYFNDFVTYPDPNELRLTATDPYFLDSLDFYFLYYRNINNVVDSLIFEVAVNNTSAQLTTSNFCCAATGNTIAINLATDTVFYKNLPYLYTSNELNLPGKQRYAFPLDSAFFASGSNHIAFSCPGLPLVQGGRFVVVGIQFKPGYTWIPNVDTLERMNSVRFISYKQNPGNNPPTTFGFPTITKKDYNISYIVPKDVRYNMAGIWNGLFIPSYAYMGSTPTYTYEHHQLFYKVRKAPQGLQELDGVVMTQISPNPVSDIATLRFKLDKTDNVQIIISDIAGRAVNTQNMGMQNAGIHTITIDASPLAKGIYTCTLKTNTISSSQKMAVVK
jgi:hypothetical protein